MPSSPLARQSLAFAAVGTVGFAVDAGMLTLLTSALGWGHYEGRALSFAAAVVVTWWLNRSWTFRARRPGRSLPLEFLAYLGTQSVGSLVNLAAYAALVEGSDLFARTPALAVAAGSLLAMIVNFLSARLLVFRP
jgi:putative flippase GtrA